MALKKLLLILLLFSTSIVFSQSNILNNYKSNFVVGTSSYRYTHVDTGTPLRSSNGATSYVREKLYFPYALTIGEIKTYIGVQKYGSGGTLTNGGTVNVCDQNMSNLFSQSFNLAYNNSAGSTPKDNTCDCFPNVVLSANTTYYIEVIATGGTMTKYFDCRNTSNGYVDIGFMGVEYGPDGTSWTTVSPKTDLYFTIFSSISVNDVNYSTPNMKINNWISWGILSSQMLFPVNSASSGYYTVKTSTSQYTINSTSILTSGQAIASTYGPYIILSTTVTIPTSFGQPSVINNILFTFYGYIKRIWNSDDN